MAKSVECAYGHRLLPVIDGLFLCECSSTGPLSSRMGIADACRQMIDKQYGSFAQYRRQMEKQTEDRKAERSLNRTSPTSSIRLDRNSPKPVGTGREDA